MKHKIYVVLKIIFFVSLLEYIGWLIKAIRVYSQGIDTNWFIPSLGKSEIVYGWDAIDQVWGQLVISSFIVWPLRIFQVIMLIVLVINLIKKIKTHNIQQNTEIEERK